MVTVQYPRHAGFEKLFSAYGGVEPHQRRKCSEPESARHFIASGTFGLRIAPELTGSAKPTEPTMNFSRIRKLSGGGLMEWCG
jgi:hypothetical protein